MKKIFWILMLACVCVSCCSCGLFVWRGSQRQPETESPSSSEAPTQEPDRPEVVSYLDLLPDADLDGMTVVLTACDGSDFASDGEDVMDAALAERTASVEEKYNVGVAVTSRGAEQIYNELQEYISRGEYYSDLIAIPLSWYGRFACEGLLTPLSAAQVDLSKPYYSATDALIYQGQTYGAIGAGCERARYAYCVYFNQRLAQEAGLDLYAVSDSGSWTWEYFLSLLQGRFGTGVACGSTVELINCVVTSCGVQYTSFSDGVRACTYPDEKMTAVLGLCNSLVYGGALCDTDYPAGLFASGGSLFYIGTVGESLSFNDMPDSYGILPLPGYEAGVPGSTYVSTDMPVLCIPAGGAAGEHAGLIFEAINAASYETLDQAYLSYLLSWGLRDNASGLSVRAIRAKMTYDFAYVFGRQYDAVADCTYGAAQTAILTGRDYTERYSSGLSAFESFVG